MLLTPMVDHTATAAQPRQPGRAAPRRHRNRTRARSGGAQGRLDAASATACFLAGTRLTEQAHHYHPRSHRNHGPWCIKAPWQRPRIPVDLQTAVAVSTWRPALRLALVWQQARAKFAKHTRKSDQEWARMLRLMETHPTASGDRRGHRPGPTTRQYCRPRWGSFRLAAAKQNQPPAGHQERKPSLMLARAVRPISMTARLIAPRGVAPLRPRFTGLTVPTPAVRQSQATLPAPLQRSDGSAKNLTCRRRTGGCLPTRSRGSYFCRHFRFTA